MRPGRGFTLIEVLVATALLAAGMALAFASLRTAGGSVARGERMAGHSEQSRTAQRFVRRQLAQALPQVFEYDSRSAMRTVFRGDERQVMFVANMPGYVGPGGPHLQTLEIVPDDDRGREGYRLQFRYELVLDGRAIGAVDDRPPVVLVDGIASGGFGYRGFQGDGEIGPWREDWPLEATLPRLVRLELEFIDPGRYWPPLATPLRLWAVDSSTEEIAPRLPRGGRGRPQ